MQKIELLLPAGNEETLKAAVENGADAVYLGIDKFNARRRATNFTLKNLKETINYCHQNGVKVYITMNTLIKNDEIKDFFNTVKELYLNNFDAVIIQEISFLPIIKKNFPNLEVHISTQAAITNSYHAQLIKQADKVVLPREFSQEEVSNFIKKTNLPTEIFVQGALCFSYSGKCLFSSILGGRSGNRGLCAQPCRKKYNQEYLLSMKDLCLIQNVPQLIKMGVSSLKVEGRLRSAKYVAAATKLYRKVIDSYYANNFTVPLALFKEMELAFNREFTKGYFNECKNLISSDKSMGRGLFLGIIEKDNYIKLKEDLAIGDGLGIWFKDKVDGAVLKQMEKDNQNIEEAKKGERIKIYVYAKEGTKIYKTSSIKKPINIDYKKNKSIKINERTVKEIILPEIKVKKLKQKELLVKVYTVKDAQESLNHGADKVFYDIFAKDFSSEYGAYIPRILNDKDVEKAIELIKKHNVKDVLIGDLGVYQLLKNESLNIYLDYSANCFNDLDLQYFKGIPIISPELNKEELRQFKSKQFAILAHGKLVLMNTKYVDLPDKLKDEKGYTFPVRKEHDYYQILNSKELGLFERITELKNSVFLDLDNNVSKMVEIYRDILDNKKVKIDKKKFTKGHWDKGVQ